MDLQNEKPRYQFQLVICDDDEDDQYLIKKAISSTGINCGVTCVNNGLQLMDLLVTTEGDQHNTLPSVIFLDLNMPLLNGFGVLQQMRDRQLIDKIGVYVFSTSSFIEDKRKSLSLGARDFLTKPNDFEVLKRLVKEICARHISALK